MRNDSMARYGYVSRTIHWIMALLIGWQLLKFFDRINEGEHWIGQTLVPWHISIGTLLLLLIVLRIVWAAKQRGHRPVQNPATASLVKIGHFLLYATMVLMPVTGILYMLGKGYGLKAFGMQLVAKGGKVAWMADIGSLHTPIAWIMLILIAGHIAITLFHYFVRKDGVLQRMM